MENPGENQSLNDAPSEFIALGELIDSEPSTSDAAALPDDSRRDLKTLRKLGYRYCNRCEQIVQPKIVSLSGRSRSFFLPYDSDRPLLSLIMSLSKTSPAHSKKTWGCPFCSRDYRRLKRVQKKHLLPPKERPKGIPRRYLILMILVLLSACCMFMYALLPRSEMGRPLSRTPSDPSIPIPGETQPLARRIVERLERLGLARFPISLESHGTSVTLSGYVPSCYEAMLIHRAVEQTPGVREVVDRLEFEPPDESHRNPLIEKGRPENLEPYLTFHIRRHVGALAHIDSVLVEADLVQIRGTVLNVEDKNHVETILHSILILRGFRLSTMLTVFDSEASRHSPDATDKVSAPDGRRAEAGGRPPQVVPNAPQRPRLPPDVSNRQRMRDKAASGESRHTPGGTKFFGVGASGCSFAYVINCSGDMVNGNTLEVAKQELVASLGQLPPEAQFSVIFYNLKIRVYADPSGQHEMMPATAANKTWVQSQFETVVPEGASAHSLALQTALELNPDVIFFLAPSNIRTKNQVPAIPSLLGRTRIHVIELGQGPDPRRVGQRSRSAVVTSSTHHYIDVTKLPMPASGN